MFRKHRQLFTKLQNGQLPLNQGGARVDMAIVATKTTCSTGTNKLLPNVIFIFMFINIKYNLRPTKIVLWIKSIIYIRRRKQLRLKRGNIM